MRKLKRVVVNKNIVKQNAKSGKRLPVISVHTSGATVEYGHEVDVVIDGKVVGTFIYRPEKPLSCGATVFFETRAELRVRRTRAKKARKTTTLEEILDTASCEVANRPEWARRPPRPPSDRAWRED